jgi:flagellar FliJ protein
VSSFVAFRFRLEPVLRHRRRGEQEAERRLAAHERQTRIRTERLAHLTAVEARARGEFLAAQAAGAAGDAVAAHRDYLRALAQRLRALAARLEAGRAEAARLREELVRRHQERRIVEKLGERKLGAYRAAHLRREQAALDEAAAVRASLRQEARGPRPE